MSWSLMAITHLRRLDRDTMPPSSPFLGEGWEEEERQIPQQIMWLVSLF